MQERIKEKRIKKKVKTALNHTNANRYENNMKRKDNEREKRHGGEKAKER